MAKIYRLPTPFDEAAKIAVRARLDELIERRMKAGLSQKDLAKLAGVLQSYVACIERMSVSVSLEMVCKMEVAIRYAELNANPVFEKPPIGPPPVEKNKQVWTLHLEEPL